MQSPAAANPPEQPKKRVADDIVGQTWVQLCVIFMVVGVATSVATYCFQILTDFTHPARQNTTGHVLLVLTLPLFVLVELS